MEVEQPDPSPRPDPWDDLLRRVKKQKVDEPMDIASVEQWCQDLLGEVARSPVAPEDEIHEARADIIEMINMEP
jgi:hypothetical protein